ncbi:hypothetical protein C5167_029164 [Papaver somniferum]|nr:hypothetical protein C5167_029164 [Papaver somniferum]
MIARVIRRTSFNGDPDPAVGKLRTEFLLGRLGKIVFNYLNSWTGLRDLAIIENAAISLPITQIRNHRGELVSVTMLKEENMILEKMNPKRLLRTKSRPNFTGSGGEETIDSHSAVMPREMDPFYDEFAITERAAKYKA